MLQGALRWGHVPPDRQGVSPVGNLPARTARRGLGPDAAWDISLWFRLMDQEQGDMETPERFKGPRPCPKARTGQLLPSLAEAATRASRQVASGLPQPPPWSPRRAQPVWAAGRERCLVQSPWAGHIFVRRSTLSRTGRKVAPLA